ncbi:MAG: hypothetical protein ACRDP3_01160 [Streptomyces sp.]|uniref:hypothetical protein n=1 Tax=Streptomyces sp. TaxID=1931 RepID=UPI003D6C6799
MSPAPPPLPMPLITRVRVDNYKSIAHCDVTLGPFTVLLGLNAAGNHHRRDGVRYRPRVDQPALTKTWISNLARANSPSFDKFWRDITYLVTGKRGE